MHDRVEHPNVRPRDEAEDQAVLSALRTAVHEAIRQHQRLENTVVVERGGQILEIPATEIDLGDDPASPKP